MEPPPRSDPPPGSVALVAALGALIASEAGPDEKRKPIAEGKEKPDFCKESKRH